MTNRYKNMNPGSYVCNYKHNSMDSVPVLSLSVPLLICYSIVCMRQIIKPLTCICLSVRAPTASVFIQL